MQNLKVWSFSSVARNTIVFMVLSVFFVVLQKSLHASLPYLNLTFLKKALVDEWVVVTLLIPAVIHVYRHNVRSRYLFGLFCSAVIFRSLEGLFLNFNKVLMVVLFLYICIAYMFYQLITYAFTRAAYSPNYAPDILLEPMAKKVSVRLVVGEKEYAGHLTNWDSSGAFVYLVAPWVHGSTNLELVVEFEGHAFQAKGSVVCATFDDRGIGIELDEDKVAESLTWTSMVDLFEEFGWEPRLLR